MIDIDIELSPGDPDSQALHQQPDASVLHDLSTLAYTVDSLPDRSRKLYRLLRKLLSSPARLGEILSGIQVLAAGDSEIMPASALD